MKIEKMEKLDLLKSVKKIQFLVLQTVILFYYFHVFMFFVLCQVHSTLTDLAGTVKEDRTSNTKVQESTLI